MPMSGGIPAPGGIPAQSTSLCYFLLISDRGVQVRRNLI